MTQDPPKRSVRSSSNGSESLELDLEDIDSKEPKDNPTVSSCTGGKRDKADPFAQRDGRALTWSDVNFSIETKSSKNRQNQGELLARTNILTNVSGAVLPRKLTAIMGHR
jgi:hypothetical protein